MAEKHNKRFGISLKLDPEFERLILDGEMPDGGISIRVGEEYLLGDENHHVESIMMGLTLVDLSKAAEAATTGATGSVELLDSGTYIVIEPHGEKTVAISKCYSSDAVEDEDERIFDPLVVSKAAVISEIVHVIEQWRDDALAINPNINHVDWFVNLQRALSDLKSVSRDGV